MKFVKTILKPGKFKARDLLTGERVEVEYTVADLQRQEKNAQAILAAGMKIPAPWDHDDSHPANVSAKNNAGFWEHVWYDPKTQLLQGIVDVPIEQDAERVGKTVQEVSPAIRNWTDGSGKVWEDTIAHVGLVIKPVQAGQDNFKPIKPPPQETVKGIVLSLYDEVVSNNAANSDGGTPSTPDAQRKAMVKDILAILGKQGITLPTDTTLENLGERILVVGKALEDNGITSNVRSGKEQQVALDLNDAANPLVKFAQDSIAQRYKSRIQTLVSSGRVTKDYAEKKLLTSLKGVALSLDADGNVQGASQLDLVLGALEALPEHSALSGKVTQGQGKGKKASVALNLEGAVEQELNNDELEDRSIADLSDPSVVDAIAAKQFKQAGRRELSGVGK